MRDLIAEAPDWPCDSIHLHWLDWHRGLGREPLLRVLGGYLKQAPEEVVLFQSDASSKPRLADESSGLRFNWSHSGDTALVAVGHGLELGVDVEARQRTINALALAERFFAEPEFRRLQTFAEEDQTGAFLRLWTGKEAVLKALGRGISQGLDRVVLSLSAEGGVRLECCAFDDVPQPTLQLRSIPTAGENAFAALAWTGAPRPVRHFREGALIADSELIPSSPFK